VIPIHLPNLLKKMDIEEKETEKKVALLQEETAIEVNRIE